MAHTRCMLDKQDYIHVRACTRPRAHTHAQTYCFSTATMVSPMHLSVTSYVHCLPCFSFFLLLCLRSGHSVVYSGYVTGWSIRSSNPYRTHVVSLPWTGETSSGSPGLAGVSCWPLTSVWCGGQEWVELHLYSPHTPSWRGEGRLELCRKWHASWTRGRNVRCDNRHWLFKRSNYLNWMC
jgi:hypothetical protein